MCNQVWVLIATNRQDFDEDSIWLAAESEVAVNEAFNDTMRQYWIALNEDDLNFYETYDKYVDAWETNVNILSVHPLPKENMTEVLESMGRE